MAFEYPAQAFQPSAGGRIYRKTGKTGQEFLASDPPGFGEASRGRSASRRCDDRGYGTSWTISGFNSTFIKAVAKLENAERVGPGLTFHGLRRTCGTLLIEAGFDIDSVRRWLGQKSLAMAIHYSQTADTSDRMHGMMKNFDPLGAKSEQKCLTQSKSV